VDATRARDAAIAWLASQDAAMEALLRELVDVSSHTADKAGVDAAGARYRAAVPLACAAIPSARYGDHLAFHAGGGAARGGVVLIGHMDTVFPREAFAGYRRDGALGRGPGALDMKGGLVVVAFALSALAEAGALEQTPLSLVVVADEEVGSPDSAAHLRALSHGARAALGFESGRAGDAIITRRRGTGSLTAVARGRAAHAGNAHAQGANAIWALARFVDRAQGLTDYARGRTVNVGVVRGGTGKNVVPDRAEAQLDLRFDALAERDWLRAELARAAQETAVPGTAIALEDGPGRPPLERTEASARLRELYARCQREAALGDGEMDLVGGGSDAATTGALGIPSIDGLGPRGEGFHTLDERVELATLRPKCEALVRYLTLPPGA
jgi:glutamate carboxypeptidase